MVLFDAWALGNKNPQIPMFNGRASRFGRNRLGTQVVGMKPVIGHQDDCGIFIGTGDQPLQNIVVIDVRVVNNVVVNFEVSFRYHLLARRVVFHEAMAEVINRVEIHGGKIPILGRQQGGRSAMGGYALTNRAHQH